MTPTGILILESGGRRMRPKPTIITITSDDLFTVDEAAEFLGIHKGSVLRLLSQGKLTKIKFGHRVYLNRAEVGAYAKKLQKINRRRRPKAKNFKPTCT